jgi:hypothetical protein
MNISEDDVRALREQKDLNQFLKDQKRAAATRHAHRRGLVLSCPDLATKLTEPPLKYKTPEQWTGFIPPATQCSGAVNTTPVRPALLALVEEAERRAAKPRKAAA